MQFKKITQPSVAWRRIERWKHNTLHTFYLFHWWFKQITQWTSNILHETQAIQLRNFILHGIWSYRPKVAEKYRSIVIIALFLHNIFKKRKPLLGFMSNLLQLQLYSVTSHALMQVMLIMMHGLQIARATLLYDIHEPLWIYHRTKLSKPHPG